MLCDIVVLMVIEKAFDRVPEKAAVDEFMTVCIDTGWDCRRRFVS